jgi:hypothetical protein
VKCTVVVVVVVVVVVSGGAGGGDKARNQGSGSTAAIGLIVHPVF